MHPRVQVREVSLKVCSVGAPRQVVHARGGIALEHEERFPKEVDAEMVEECGEPLLLPLPCGLPYAVERLGHTSPAQSPVCALLARVPLGPRPWLHGSAAAAVLAPALFVGFAATTAVSDFSRSCIIGYGSSPSRCGPGQHAAPLLLADREISRFPSKKLLHMPGPVTTPDRPGARDGAPVRVAFHIRNCVGIRDEGFRGSMAGLYSPLPTLRRHPRERLRTARGRCGSLLLHRKGLAPSTSCRFRRRTPKPVTMDEIAIAIARCAGCPADGVATAESIDSGVGRAIHYGDKIFFDR